MYTESLTYTYGTGQEIMATKRKRTTRKRGRATRRRSRSPYQIHKLRVGECADGTPIEVCVYVAGNPRGLPVVHLHGGPGDRFYPKILNSFDLDRYHFVSFDQRGCGRSRPRPLVEPGANTTQRLLEDMELIRTHVMRVDAWVVAGGSWGAALAVLYAQAHPSRVRGLLLRGFTDLTESCVYDHMYADKRAETFRTLSLDPKRHSDKRMNRELHALFAGALPRRRLPEAETKKHVVRAARRTRRIRTILDQYTDGQIYTIRQLSPKEKAKAKEKDARLFDDFANAVTTYHYGVNKYFLGPKQMVRERNVARLRKIPAYFVQGRYDVVCPFKMAYEMSERLPKSELLVAHGGHTMSNPEISRLFRRACDDMLRQLAPRRKK